MRSDFARWLFAHPKTPNTLWKVIAWWESRRLAFNLIIGVYGVLCLAVFLASISARGHLQPGEDAVEPLALFASPIVINVLYSLGWVVEWTLRILRPEAPLLFGPRLLQLGIGFGLFLSTIPAAIELLRWVLPSLHR